MKNVILSANIFIPVISICLLNPKAILAFYKDDIKTDSVIITLVEIILNSDRNYTLFFKLKPSTRSMLAFYPNTNFVFLVNALKNLTPAVL